MKKTLLFLAAVLTLMTVLSAPSIASADIPYCPVGVPCN